MYFAAMSSGQAPTVAVALAERSVAEPLKVIGVLDRVILLDPDDVGARRDRGLLSLRWGDPQPGIQDLEHYLHLEPEAPDAESVEKLLVEARRRMGQVH